MTRNSDAVLALKKFRPVGPSSMDVDLEQIFPSHVEIGSCGLNYSTQSCSRKTKPMKRHLRPPLSWVFAAEAKAELRASFVKGSRVGWTTTSPRRILVAISSVVRSALYTNPACGCNSAGWRCKKAAPPVGCTAPVTLTAMVTKQHNRGDTSGKGRDTAAGQQTNMYSTHVSMQGSKYKDVWLCQIRKSHVVTNPQADKVENMHMQPKAPPQGVHVVETDFVARIVGDGCAKSFSPSGLQIGLF